MKTDPEHFILANTTLGTPPHVPEIRLHLADEAHDLWLKTEDELEEIGLPPPFWAFAWAGGQGLARHILDNPDLVKPANRCSISPRDRDWWQLRPVLAAHPG
jgi:predicted nicotinamide N-methyase